VATVLLARAFLGERLRGVQAAGVGATLLGVALVAGG
jgi:drug/metabolite transporter (DMT)-like permease